MDKIKLTASRRGVIGKKVKLLRKDGQLPAVIYGQNMDPLSVTLDLRETTKILRDVGRSSVLTIEVEGEEINALVRERQREVITGEYLHIDFLAISLTEKVRTQVGIVLEGESLAIKEFNAVLITGLDRLDIECLPGDLPERIVVDISSITGIGDGIYVKDLVISDKVDVFEDPDDMIVVATAPSLVEEEEVVEEEELEEEELEPEVIEKGKREEGEPEEE
jgi:large subunit ribosomal protein L25